MKKCAFCLGVLIYCLFLAQVASGGAVAKNSSGRFVLLPDPADPTVSLRFLLRAGAQNDPKGKEGLAALTAAMVTRGGTKRRSYEELVRLLYPMAAQVDGHVDKEMTVISGRTHKDNLDTYSDLFMEVMREPAFREGDFKRLRTDAINFVETTLRYGDDEELGKAALGEFVFAGTPYGHLHVGYVSSLQAITLDDVKAFYKKHYTPANLTVGIGGGLQRGACGENPAESAEASGWKAGRPPDDQAGGHSRSSDPDH